MVTFYLFSSGKTLSFLLLFMEQISSTL